MVDEERPLSIVQIWWPVAALIGAVLGAELMLTLGGCQAADNPGVHDFGPGDGLLIPRGSTIMPPVGGHLTIFRTGGSPSERASIVIPNDDLVAACGLAMELAERIERIGPDGQCPTPAETNTELWLIHRQAALRPPPATGSRPAD